MSNTNDRTKGIIKRSVIAAVTAAAIVVTATIVIPKISKPVNKMESTKELYRSLSEAEKNEITAIMDAPSDIEGMTRGEKYAAGMSFKNGSDTDGDGLTDKEEVETYKTDPLKVSTMDDGYSDSYKVAHGMDLFAYCENENMTFKGNKLDYVTLNTKTARNEDAKVSESNFDYYINDIEPYKMIKLGKYKGSVTIDVTDILNDNDVNIKDLAVYNGGPELAPNGEYAQIKDVKIDGNTLTFNTSEELCHTDMVLIAKKQKNGGLFGAGKQLNAGNKSLLDREMELNPRMKASESDDEEEKARENADGITYAATAPLMFAKEKPKVYYVETGNENVDKETRRRMIETANFVFEKEYIKFELTEDDCKGVSKPTLILMRKVMEAMPGFKHYTCDWNDLDPINGLPRKSIIANFTNYEDFNFLDTYSEEDDPWNKLAQNKPDSLKHSKKTHFDPLRFDSRAPEGFQHFRFSNFGTIFSEGGNCSAISHVTAYANEHHSLPETTGKIFDSKEDDELLDVRNVDTGELDKISNTWTITPGEEDNDYLLSGELSNYKTEDFIREHYYRPSNIVASNLSPSETEFIKMLAAYQNRPEAGFSFRNDFYMLGDRFDPKLLEIMTQHLDEGKILKLGISFNNGGHYASFGKTEEERRKAWRDYLLSFCYNRDEYDYNDINSSNIEFHLHCINIVGYEKYEFKDNSYCYDLYIYDSNYPDEIKTLQVSMDEYGELESMFYMPGSGDWFEYDPGTFESESDFVFTVLDSDDNNLEDVADLDIRRDGIRYDAYDLFRLGDMTLTEAMELTYCRGDVDIFRCDYQSDVFEDYEAGKLTLTEAAEAIHATEDEFLDYFERSKNHLYCPMDPFEEDISDYPNMNDWLECVSGQ